MKAGLGEDPKAVATAQSIESLVGAVKALVETKADKERSASNELRGEMTELKKQVTFLKKAYSDATTELEMTQIQMEAGSSPALQARIKQLEQDATSLEEAKRAMKELTTALAVSEEEKSMITQERDLAKQENSKLGLKLVTMATERQELEAELATSRANEEEMAKLLKEKEIVQGEFKRLTDRYVDVNDEKAKLQEQLAAVQMELGEALAAPSGAGPRASDAVRAEVKRLTQQVVSASEENARLREKLQDVAAVEELEQLAVQGTAAVPPAPTANVAAAAPPAPAPEAPVVPAAPAKSTAEAIEQWLGLLRLEKYFPALLQQGYDDLAILRDADAEEVGAIIKVVGMPRGHAKVFIRGLLQLAEARAREAVPA